MIETEKKTVHTLVIVYYVSIVVAIVLCAVTPNQQHLGWALSLLATGWIGGLTFALIRRPAWFFDFLARLP